MRRLISALLLSAIAVAVPALAQGGDVVAGRVNGTGAIRPLNTDNDGKLNVNGGGGGGSVPTGTAGAPNASVLSVQGVSGGTPQNVNIANSPTIANTTFAATTANGGDVAQGNTGDVAYTGTGAATLVSALKGVYAATLAPISAGTNNIGTSGLPDGAAVTTTSGAALNAILFSVDMTGYGGVGFQLTGTWVATATLQYSDDNVNWFTGSGVGGTGLSGSTSNANSGFYIPAQHRWARVILTAYTSGTVNSVAYLRSSGIQVAPAQVSAILASSGSTIGVLAAGSNSIGNVGLNSGVNTIGNVFRAQYYTETTTALAASASSPATSRDTGVAAATNNPWNYFSCLARSDQAGTLFQQTSPDNVTYTIIQSVAMAAGVPARTSERVFARYNRCFVTNGATAQTSLLLLSQYGE